jgi:hypothetical protein
MPVDAKGVLELRRAIKKIAPDVAKESQKEIGSLLRVITNRAKGFVPSEAPLSGWGKSVGLWAVPYSNGENRVYDAGAIKRGITFSAAPSKANKRGFRSLATIYNKSAAGAIYETAGRKSPNGQPPQASTKGKYSNYIDTSSNVNKSANPKAGKQFIDALPPLYKVQRREGQGGRVSRKMNGRLIFRAWGEDQGKINAQVLKAIERSVDKVLVITKGKSEIDVRGR